jgi:ketosteroid isomerase-like protein
MTSSRREGLVSVNASDRTGMNKVGAGRLKTPFGLPALALVAALCAAPAFAAAEHDDVDRLTAAGKLDDAMARADRFLANHPRDPQMRFLKGVIQIDAGKRAEAIATFTQLTQDVPDLPEPYNNLAVLYAAQGQFDKAQATLESAIRTNPSYATAHENLGDIYARRASESYSKALQLDQGNSASAVPSKLAVIRTLFGTGAPGERKAAALASAPGAAASAPGRAASAPAAATAAKPSPAPAVAAASPAAPVAPATAPAPAAPRPSTPVAAAAAPSALPAAAAPVAPAAPPPATSPQPADAAAASADVEAAVRKWAAAWAAQDMDGYLGAYDAEFAPPGNQARKAWEEERRARIVGKSAISVDVRNLEVAVDGDSATAKFRQAYRADTLNVTSRKTLELVRHAGQWRIRKEIVGR